MKNKAIKIVGTIVIVGGMVFFASGVGAQEISGRMMKQGNANFTKMIDGDDDTRGDGMVIRHIGSEEAEAIRTALENKDYETWKTLVAAQEENLPEGAKSLLEKIDSEEAFMDFAEGMSEKMAAKQIREELREKINAAIEANDYETWKELLAEREANIENLKYSILEKIDTEEKFAQLVKIQELQKQIKEIKEGLGLLDLGNQVGHRLGQR